MNSALNDSDSGFETFTFHQWKDVCAEPFPAQFKELLQNHLLWSNFLDFVLKTLQRLKRPCAKGCF